METLEYKIRFINREILRLKTAHPIASSLKTYYGEYYWVEGSRPGVDIYEITYAPGTNTIMTWSGWAWGTSGGIILGEVQNDKQRFYDWNPYHTPSYTADFSIFSTRPILSVRYLGNF